MVARVAELLVIAGARVDARDENGLTAYARAVRGGRTEPAATLERLGVPTDVPPLAQLLGAAVTGDGDAVAALLTADPGLPAQLTPADHELLVVWASAGDEGVVTRLLDLGVPLDARGVDGGTALHFAGLWGRPGAVALLLDRGADPELVSGSEYAPGTALNWVAWGSRNVEGADRRQPEYLAAAERLLAAGARPTARMAEGASDGLGARLERALGG